MFEKLNFCSIIVLSKTKRLGNLTALSVSGQPERNQLIQEDCFMLPLNEQYSQSIPKIARSAAFQGGAA